MNQLIQSWLLKLKTQLVHLNGTQFVEKKVIYVHNLKNKFPQEMLPYKMNSPVLFSYMYGEHLSSVEI